MDDQQWGLIRPIIERYRLKENDTVFAYDLAWEPNWGNRGARAAYDGRWSDWVRAKHGSIDAAEKSWGYTVRRAGNDIEGPSDREVTFDGDWRKMVLDYRAFLGDLLQGAPAAVLGPPVLDEVPHRLFLAGASGQG